MKRNRLDTALKHAEKEREAEEIESILDNAPNGIVRDEDERWLVDHGFLPDQWDADEESFVTCWCRAFPDIVKAPPEWWDPDDDDGDYSSFNEDEMEDCTVYIRIGKHATREWFAVVNWDTDWPPKGIDDSDEGSEYGGATPVEALMELNKHINLYTLLGQKKQEVGGQIQ